MVLSRLDYGNSVLVGLPAYLVRRLQSVQNSADLQSMTLRSHHRCAGQSALAAHPGARLQGRSSDIEDPPWERAGIPWSCHSHRRSSWSTSSPLFWHQPSGGATFQAVFDRLSGFPGGRSSNLEQSAGRHHVSQVTAYFSSKT